MFKYIAIALGGLGAAVAGIAATKPDTFRVERTTTIQASPEDVFALITDFRRWEAWSPWEARDPAMVRTHSGSAAGEGAVYGWTGNREVGEGRMEIVDTTPPSRAVIKLDFIKPFKSTSTCEFILTGNDGRTTVTWAMYGPNNIMSKLMTVFVSMDKMIGKDFEAGLSKMKRAAEVEANRSTSGR